jgi:hypothetical protein
MQKSRTQGKMDAMAGALNCVDPTADTAIPDQRKAAATLNFTAFSLKKLGSRSSSRDFRHS